MRGKKGGWKSVRNSISKIGSKGETKIFAEMSSLWSSTNICLFVCLIDLIGTFSRKLKFREVK